MKYTLVVLNSSITAKFLIKTSAACATKTTYPYLLLNVSSQQCSSWIRESVERAEGLSSGKRLINQNSVMNERVLHSTVGDLTKNIFTQFWLAILPEHQ